MIKDMKTIPGFPNYAITKTGKIWSRKTKKFLKPYNNGSSSKYKKILLNNSVKKYIHRLVLETFIGPCPKGMECCHNDGNPENNNLNNLRWDTHSSNNKDAVRHGTWKNTWMKGENHPQAKLTFDDVKEIRKLYQDKILSQTNLAKNYGVTQATISRIVLNQTWNY